MKLSEVAEKVIALAQARRDYWETELPKRHRNYHFVEPGEDSGPPPPQEAELQKLLSGLPKDAVYKLILIVYLGRGDFDASSLGEHLASRLEDIKTTFPRAEQAVRQMMGKLSLGDYLTDGLDELKKHGIDANRLVPTPAKQRR